MGLNEFLGKWGVFLCSVADGLLIVRATSAHRCCTRGIRGPYVVCARGCAFVWCRASD